MPDLTLFIDDGGVLSDNSRRGPEWRRLVAEFFPPRLGGEPQAWSEANRATWRQVAEAHQPALAVEGHYVAGLKAYERDWLVAMCEHVGIAPPQGDACDALAREASLYIMRRVRAAFPHAAEAVAALADAGYTLHTASNQASWELEAYLAPMGVVDRFGLLFGADLVDCMKPNPRYYERAFALAEVDPAQALVLDDTPEFLDAAREVGAGTVLVGAGEPAPGRLAIPSLEALPALLQGLG